MNSPLSDGVTELMLQARTLKEMKQAFIQAKKWVENPVTALLMQKHMTVKKAGRPVNDLQELKNLINKLYVITPEVPLRYKREIAKYLSELINKKYPHVSGVTTSRIERIIAFQLLDAGAIKIWIKEKA